MIDKSLRSAWFRIELIPSKPFHFFILAILTLTGCSQLASAGEFVEPAPTGIPLLVSATPSAGIPLVVSATPSAGIPLVVTATPSILPAEATATTSGALLVVTATPSEMISAPALNAPNLSSQADSDLIADCQQFKDDPSDFTVTRFSGDVVNYSKWKDSDDSPGVMGLFSVELDTRGNNPSDGILDEVHGLVICYDEVADAKSSFDHRLTNQGSESLDVNTELTEGWGSDPDKYIVSIRYRNLVLQIKGLRDGGTRDNSVIQATLFQAMEALENVSALDLVLE